MIFRQAITNLQSTYVSYFEKILPKNLPDSTLVHAVKETVIKTVHPEIRQQWLVLEKEQMSKWNLEKLPVLVVIVNLVQAFLSGFVWKNM